jgi:secondary thiamine-phosphate synthase enzyme
MIEILHIKTSRQGLLEITDQVTQLINKAPASNGICHLFIQHTSASLIIQENADPSARYDLETWINRLVPENDPHYTHTYEGADDMPAHIKAILTNTSLAIPVLQGNLILGQWQGIYLWEHRRGGSTRKIIVTLQRI